ncbi:MAG: exo-alpha-sialidase [Eubacteriales bacterium]
MNGFSEENAKEVLMSVNNRCSDTKDLSCRVERSRIYTPDGTESAWYYTHHPFITKFRGRFYVFYSSGRRNEDDCGQRIMMAVSDDFKSWSISPLVDSVMGEASERVLYCKGCYIRDGVMTVYYHGYEYDSAGLRQNDDGTALRPLEENCRRINHCTFCISTPDGMTWSKPKELGYLIGGNLSPVEYGGLLLWAGYGSLACSDKLSGTDDWQNIRLRLDPDTERPRAITESGMYRTADGAIVLMSRTNGGCMLAAASFDGGKSWTDMYRSQFEDYGAKFQLGELSDGRYYFLGNNSKARAELVFVTSEDGINFSRFYLLGDKPYEQVRKGLYKGGVYGYPTNYFDGEYMYVVYSLDKEGLEAMRVKLTDLDIV